MSPEASKPTNQSNLIIRPSTGLVHVSEGVSSALTEMVSRSLAHIQASADLVVLERRAGEEQEFEIAPGVKIVMCWIPPGECLMGSPEDELGRSHREKQHRITITQGFWMGKYQVTQKQWESVMESNPSKFKGSQLPIETVSWDDIAGPKGFLEKISRKNGAVYCFSLPTESQWEYACRAGTVTALNSGKNLTIAEGKCPNLEEVAWYAENSGGETHPVGQKKANAWGLHDMHGNLLEWCADWHAQYLSGSMVDSVGSDSGSCRVRRGGSWYGRAHYCRAATRNYGDPICGYSNIGFRIARSSVPLEVLNV